MNQQTGNKYDSAFCGSLPIHLINVIQPYGALLVIEQASLRITQASENVQAIFHKPVAELVNTMLDAYISPSSVALLRDTFSGPATDKVPLSWEIGGKKFVVLMHVKPPYYMAEINLEADPGTGQLSFVDVFQDLKHAMSAIGAATTIAEVAGVAARELKKASGFDKVMVYRFDKEWNGHVMAEVMEPGMESYLDFTFPASDIPRQARDLYLRNAYRFIPDREYQPVKLYPVINPATNAFIDLSDCNIRGVSAVHLEYLKNMQVNASMSTRIIKDDRLWGLIACHHRTARKMDYKMCAVFELLSGIISAKITSLEYREKHDLDVLLQQMYTSLVEETYRVGDIQESLLHADLNILQLFRAGGAVIIYNGITRQAGDAPEKHQLDDLLLWLHTLELRKVFYTDNLQAQYDYAADYRGIASGLLVIPINSRKDEYILLFRPEVLKVINWGGNPEERMFFEKDMKTYHPRFSFRLWQEKVSGVSVPWNEEELNKAESLRSFVYEYTTGHHL